MPKNMFDPVTGNTFSVPDDQVDAALARKWTVEGEPQAAARLVGDVKQETYGTVPGKVASFGAGALSTATGGLFDVAAGALGGQEAVDELNALRSTNPVATVAGEIGGVFMPGGLGKAASKAGKAVASLGEGGGAVAKIAGSAAGGAAEGLIGGAGSATGELARSADPLTIERVGSSFTSNMLFGGAVGGTVGGVVKAGDVALRKGKRALDAAVERNAAQSAVADDLSGLGHKELRLAKQAELDSIEAARVPQREELAKEISSFRRELKEQKQFLTTKDVKLSASGGLLGAAELGRISAKANKQLDNILDNPISIAKNPAKAVDALQRQENALLKTLERDADLRLAYEAEQAVKDPFDVANMTKAQRKAIDTYTGGEFAPINRHLRGGKHWGKEVPSSYKLTSKQSVGATIKQLDSMIARSPLEETVLYRGLTGRNFKAGKVGDIVSDPGFQSATRNRKVAEGFTKHADGQQGSGYVLELEIPRGSRGLEASKIMGGAEDEILLGRGLSYEVMSVENGIVRARMVPSSKNAGARAAALDTVAPALERNRALQARITALTASPTSPRLAQIADAESALAMGGAPKSLPEKALGGAAFGAVSGLISSIPIPGAQLLGSFLGAKAADMVGTKVFGRAAKSIEETLIRTQRAVDAFIDVSGKVAPHVPVVATKVLAAVKYGSDEPTKSKKAAGPAKLAELYKARTDEIKSQVVRDETGQSRMRPEARDRVAANLSPIRAVNPIMADRLESQAARNLEFLAGKMPRRPEIGVVQTGPDRWQPSDMEMRQWARFAAGVEDPGGIEERLADGTITPEDAEVLQTCYPERFAHIKMSVLQKLPELRQSLPYSRRLALSIFTGVPVDAAMHPQVLSALQSSFVDEPGTEGGTQAPAAAPQFGSVKAEPATPAQQRGAS